MIETAMRYRDGKTGRVLVTQGHFTESLEKAFAHVDIMHSLGHTEVEVVQRTVTDWERAR